MEIWLESRPYFASVILLNLLAISASRFAPAFSPEARGAILRDSILEGLAKEFWDY